MRSCPLQYASLPFPSRNAEHPARKLPCLGENAGLPPRPAQGLTPPLHLRKELRPLTHFRWRVPVELTQSAVSNASRLRGHSRPLGEGGRAQRGRMRSCPVRFRNLVGTPARFCRVDSICRFQRGRPSAPARKLWLLFVPFFVPLCCAWAAAQTCAGANAAPAPAQGASPLDPFSLARSRGDDSICRFQRGRPSAPARKLWLLFVPFLLFPCAAPGLPPRPAQGLTPPLHPRKGFRPLTRSTLARSLRLV